METDMHGPYSGPGIWSSKWIRFWTLWVRNMVPKMRPFFATGRTNKKHPGSPKMRYSKGRKQSAAKADRLPGSSTRSRQTKAKSGSSWFVSASWMPLSIQEQTLLCEAMLTLPAVIVYLYVLGCAWHVWVAS